MPSSKASIFFRHFVINIFVLIILLPLAWVFFTSIKSVPDAYSGDLWPNEFDFSHYKFVITEIDTIPSNMRNSIIVTLATVFTTTTCAIFSGYALVHLKLPGGIYCHWYIDSDFVLPS